MRNLLILVWNDLAIAFKNKSVLLILFIPFFVFLTLKLIDSNEAGAKKIHIGLIKDFDYPGPLAPSLQSARSVVEITWVADPAEAARLLNEDRIDGALVASDQGAGGLTLLVAKKDSVKALALLQLFSGLQRAAEGQPRSWITGLQGLHDGNLQKQTMPTWILMLVLLVGFIILPTQVAEEKEKKLLVALLQTPIHDSQWLAAKMISGMVLIFASVGLLHVLGQFGPGHLLDYSLLLVAASFCFSAFGVFLGFLCRSQAGARTLGVIVYLIMLLPSALADYSRNLTLVAPVLPSYQFFGPLKAIVLEDGRITSFPIEMLSLVVAGGITFFLAQFLMKKRWLM
jgi:ABC-2 type transport system permease protein